MQVPLTQLEASRLCAVNSPQWLADPRGDLAHQVFCSWDHPRRLCSHESAQRDAGCWLGAAPCMASCSPPCCCTAPCMAGCSPPCCCASCSLCLVPVGAWLSQAGVLREWAQDIRSAARGAAAGEAVHGPDVCKQLCARRAMCRSTPGYSACVPHLCCYPVSN